MDVQFFGANCLVFTSKDQRVVVDDNLSALGAKSVTKAGDLTLFTSKQHQDTPNDVRMVVDMPGEYEVGNLSIVGIPARAHMDEDEKSLNATMYKLTAGELQYLVTGHVFPALTDDELEAIGIIDVMFVPVGGNGFTVDPIGALKLIKAVEPKLVVPTHYNDKGLKFEVPQQELSDALKEIAMEPKERVQRLKLKPMELSDVTQLVILERS
ncbi:MBL fold metallo-hydrolase [Candidatus Saccharibacteria bacterium]|nr:MBL fold metallo-hydrolase [Candidatus Saccharibacteria bacterium]